MHITNYIFLFFNFIIATIILYLPIAFMLKKRGTRYPRQLSYLLCFWSLFLIIFVTIILFNLPIRIQVAHAILNLTPLQWIQEANVMQRIRNEVLPNIILFIPLGIFIPIVFKQMRQLHMTTIMTLTVTISVEFLQYFIGRSSDIDDIIANVLGGLIGYGIFTCLGHMCKNKQYWHILTGEPLL